VKHKNEELRVPSKMATSQIGDVRRDRLHPLAPLSKFDPRYFEKVAD
jgi:hypothetical protein